MVRELYIDDQRVDLPDEVRFQLTFQIADFGDLSPRGSGSNTIKLPKTPRNVGIFERCNFVQVASNFPYALHSAYYYEDGFLVFNDATVYMLAITEKDFEIQCVWGNATEIRRLKALDMGNVANLGNVNYQPVTYGMMETGMIGKYGYAEPIPLATRGSGLRSSFTRGLLNIKTALDNIPNIKVEYSPSVLAYLENLYAFPALQKANIEYNNVIFNAEINQNLNNNPEDYIQLEYVNGEVTLHSDPYERRKAFMKIANNDRTITTQGGTPFDTIVAPFTLKGGWYDIQVEISNINFQYKTGTTPYQKDTDILSAVFVLGQILASNDNMQYTANSDSSLVIKIDRDWKIEGKTYSGSKRIYIDDIEIDMGNGIKAVPQLYCALWPSFSVPYHLEEAVSANVKITMSAVQALTEVNINMPDETTQGVKNYITIAMTDILRGTKAYDFLAQSLVNAGAIFETKDGKTRVFTYEDIANNTAHMLDWTDKLVYIQEENTFNQSGGSQNEIKYKPSEYYNGFGDGAYTDPLAYELEKENKTVVENSLFGFNNGVFLVGLGNPLTIPFVLEKTNNGVIEYEYKDRGWILGRFLGQSNIPITNKDNGYIKPVQYALLGAQVQPTFGNIESTNWSSYIAMQQAYRKAKALFMLSPRDVAELDFRKPIYLRQYAQAYVVTKVNYQPHASTVELMLIR